MTRYTVWISEGPVSDSLPDTFDDLNAAVEAGETSTDGRYIIYDENGKNVARGNGNREFNRV